MPTIAFPLVSAMYCSKECQVNDWKQGGHKFACKNMLDSGLQVLQRGGSRKEAKMARANDHNVRAVASKLVLTHICRIMTQAVLQKYDIFDCVTVINLCQAPPTLQVRLASALYGDFSVAGDECYDDMKRCFERIWADGSLALLIGTFRPCSLIDSIQSFYMESIPKFHAPSGSWSVYQADMRKKLDASVTILQCHPDQLEKQLKDLMLT